MAPEGNTMIVEEEIRKLISKIEAGETITYDSYPHDWLNGLFYAQFRAPFDANGAIELFIGNPTEENKKAVLEDLKNTLEVWREEEEEAEQEWGIFPPLLFYFICTSAITCDIIKMSLHQGGTIMSHIIPPEEPIFARGMNGNYYVYCKYRDPVAEVAKKIGKAVSSVYFNDKYKVWAIRTKNSTHKQRLKELFIPPRR